MGRLAAAGATRNPFAMFSAMSSFLSAVVVDGVRPLVALGVDVNTLGLEVARAFVEFLGDGVLPFLETTTNPPPTPLSSLLPPCAV